MIYGVLYDLAPPYLQCSIMKSEWKRCMKYSSVCKSKTKRNPRVSRHVFIGMKPIAAERKKEMRGIMALSLSITQSLIIIFFVRLSFSLLSLDGLLLIFLFLASLCKKSDVEVTPAALCVIVHFYPPTEAVDVNGNSWLREIWWKVSQPVFTPSQMALNKLGEKTQIHFSEKGLTQGSVLGLSLSLSLFAARNQRWLFQEPALESESYPKVAV